MKIIWIAAECSYPVNTGSRVVTWNRIKYLSKNNDIHLYSIVDSSDEFQYKKNLGDICKSVHLYTREKNFSTLIKSFVYPFPAVSRWTKQMKLDLAAHCKQEEIDVIVVDFPQMMGIVPAGQKIVLNQHNIEYQSLASIASSIRNPVKRLIFKVVAWQMQRYEAKLYRSSNISLQTFVSIDDKIFFDKRFPESNTFLSPIGTECKRAQEAPINEYNVVFVAKMSYTPNAIGALWLTKSVWPLIKKEVPEAKLYLVGKDPSQELKDIACTDRSIVVTGTVNSVDSYYNLANVIVVPIMNGGGVKVKLIESLGKGKIVVTTTKGIEGTDFKPNEHVLTADNAPNFANHCINVLKSTKNYQCMGSRAYEKVQRDYSWDFIVSRLNNHLKDICKQ